MDTYAGNNENPLSLHKYLYGADDPVNRIDPSGHDDIAIAEITTVFMLEFTIASMPNLPTVGEAVAPLASGSWHITPKHDIDTSAAGMSDLAVALGCSDGFQVTYTDAGGCANGEIVVYQIIASSSMFFAPDVQVDRGADSFGHAKPGQPLPPPMGGTIAGTSLASYIDAPGGPNVSGPPYWRVTAVAVCRSNGRDKLLSTTYFEFDDKTREIMSIIPDNRKDFVAGMKKWGVDTGVLNGIK